MLPELEPLPELLLVPVVVDAVLEPAVVVDVAPPEPDVDDVVVVPAEVELDVEEPAELPLQPASASASKADVANERMSIRRF